jgi:hypothetical protein
MKATILRSGAYKTFPLIIFIILFGGTAIAQTGLQFLGVKHIEIAANGTSSVSITSGKVWKIESVSMGSTGSAPAVLLKNSNAQNIAFFSSAANSSSAAYPYWLPASFTGTFVNNNPNYRCSISITEYSVSP